ncbi:MAG: DUF3971 domain-containing protein [Micavibrio sp.]|nr:DUF3971 domain-containing protein [Micavibrio sp.]
MLKKAIHHVNRTVVVCFEIAGLLALLVFLGWVGLIWRLSQGPLAVNDYLTKKVESAFNDEIKGFVFGIGGAEMIWGGRFQPFELEIKDLHITRDDHTRVLDVKKLRVQLSKRNLAFGRIVPRVVKIYGPTLRVIRQEDGRFSLNVGEETDKASPVMGPLQGPLIGPVQGPVLAPPAATAGPVTESREALVKGILGQFRERNGLGILDGLHDIEIIDAAVLYEDRILNVAWRSVDADVRASRSDHGISSNAIISLDMDQGANPATDNKAAVRAEVSYDWDRKKTSAVVSFSGFVPARVAQQSLQLKALSGIDMPFMGSIGLDLDEDFKPAAARFTLGADAGTFNALDLYQQPINVKSIFARGTMDAASGAALIDQLKIDLNGPVVTAGAKIETEDGAHKISAVAALTDMPIDALDTYWPPALAAEARAWVVHHLSKGTATSATIEADATYDPAAEKHVTLTKLDGKITFNGITVDYLPPMPTVKEVAGTANYNASSFNLDLTSGKLQDMTVTKSTIHITDLDRIVLHEHSKIDIAVDLNGPLRTALKVIDSDPLRYPEKLGMKTDDVEGRADVNVSFKFPLHKGLTLHEVAIGAQAKLNDVLLKSMVAGMDVTGGPMDLDVDSTRLKVSGKGRLGGMPMDFDWLKNFAADNAVASHVTASLPLDAPAMAKFGVPADLNVTGTLPAKITYTAAPDKTATLELTGDIKNAGFNIAAIDYKKPEGQAGDIALNVNLKDGQAQRIQGLDISTDGFAAKGDIDLIPGAKGLDAIKKATLPSLKYGKNVISLDADNKGKDGFAVKISGSQVDASALLKTGSDTPNSDAEAAVQSPPLRLAMNVSRLITSRDAAGKERGLDNVKLTLLRNSWKRIEQLTLDATAANKPLSIDYGPQGKGHALKLKAASAGAALSALGFTHSIRGGALSITATPLATGPRDLTGRVILTDFKLNDAPVIAKLVNAMSLNGIIELLNGEGVNFKKAQVNFTWTDRGQPGQSQNVRLLSLREGQTSGASLALLFEGNIDNWKNVYDLHGTIVPVSGINRFLNVIPILGTVLTAGGEGIIAATYTVTGPKDKPDVSVNPLSALAPGILRKILFEH